MTVRMQSPASWAFIYNKQTRANRINRIHIELTTDITYASKIELS